MGWRRLAMGLATVLGLKPRGFFIPYRYADSLPGPGERPADRSRHSLLDPLLEPYAFVLEDALDSLEPVPDPPMVEVGALWQPGEAQPGEAHPGEAHRGEDDDDN